MRLNGNLIEETTGVNCSTMYDIPNCRDGNGYWFEIVYTTDPTDPTRRCLKRGTSTRMKGCYSIFRMPNVLEPNENDPTIYKCYLTASTTSSNWCNLIGKTLEFSYYPNQVNNNRKIIINNSDRDAGGAVSGAKTMDLYQYGTSFILYVNSTLGNNIQLTLASGIVSNKWYRFKIEHIDIGNEEFYYRISVFDNDTLIGYQDETNMGIFYYGSRQTNNRWQCFFNTHYNYFCGYSGVANTTALLKDILIYYND